MAKMSTITVTVNNHNVMTTMFKENISRITLEAHLNLWWLVAVVGLWAEVLPCYNIYLLISCSHFITDAKIFVLVAATCDWRLWFLTQEDSTAQWSWQNLPIRSEDPRMIKLTRNFLLTSSGCGACLWLCASPVVARASVLCVCSVRLSGSLDNHRYHRRI